MAIKVGIVGCTGKMGKLLQKLMENSLDFQFCGGINQGHTSEEIKYADVIIDVSSPDALDKSLSLQKPLVIATTGYTEQHLARVKMYSCDYPVMQSTNFSIGMALLKNTAQWVAQKFSCSSINILEKHHKNKKDAPSGSALGLQDMLQKTLPEGKSITIHSIREGEIVGDHKVTFEGDMETLSLQHIAENREIFAKGALHAAKWIVRKKNGLYSINDMLQIEEETCTPSK